MKIFVPLVGQHENIGDIVLRRELVEWLSPEGELHVYVGASTDAYDRSLELPSDAVVYRSVKAWGAALASALRGSRDVAYVYKPGEIQLTIAGLKEHVGLLPLVVATRARGGVVVRVGAGSRNFDTFPTAVLRSTLGLAHYTAWRDTRTARIMRRGEVMPDLGFGQIGRADGDKRERTRLTVTMRGDRDAPSSTWREAVRATADDLGLALTVVTQVERDEPLGAELAAEWDADYIAWTGRDHAEQEDAVRRVFDESALVVSDRLHALIVALTEGAAVSTVADGPTDKIQRHFDAAGVPIIAVDSAQATPDEIRRRLADAADSRESQQEALGRAVEKLREVRDTVRTTLRRRR